MIIGVSISVLVNFAIGFVSADILDKNTRLSFYAVFKHKLFPQFVLGSICALLGGIIAVFYFTKPISFETIFVLIISNLVILFLILSAYFDIKYFEVFDTFSLIAVLILIGLNLNGLLIYGSEANLVIFNNLEYQPLSHLFGGFLGWLLFSIIVFSTEEKGMGSGDIRIATILGLSLGLWKFVLAMYFSIFSALLYGILVGVSRKSFKKLKLPFVPFLAFGGIFSLFVPFDFLEFMESLQHIIF
jgi:prepilin signal peptidase PulO-like enzyme (type II secretory pathway)